mmetsp:Transcript_25164/g.44073  ORF Transcript_25164/g.44073 Transcript_25164/m.44073 type:complete len:338 (+) Transcript_25164:153-1166(+)
MSVQIMKMNEEWKSEKEAMTEDFKDKLNYQEVSHKKEVENLQLKIKEVESELKSLSEYKENKQKTDEELEGYRQKYDSLHREFTAQKNRLEQRRLIELERLKKEHSNAIAAIKETALIQARKELTQSAKDVHEVNQKLMNDMQMQTTEVESLKRERNKLLDENKRLRQELELTEQNLEGYSAKQLEHSRTVRMLVEKIKLLEASLNKLAGDAAREKELLSYDVEQKLKEKEDEIESLNLQIKLRSKEIKKIKALAQMILDQRSDVEQFFIDALAQIKEEVGKRGKKLPAIGRGQDNRVKLSDKVDISELDWEDRERVLRLLFARMNTGVPPANWRAS